MAPTKKLSPLVGESVSGADERGKSEQKRKRVFYGKAVNTCLSFLNEVKNLAKDTGINILTYVLKLVPIASQARHFPRQRGKLTLR